jgi:uncharacterized protein YoxC
MDATSIVNLVLPIVFVLVGVVLVWFLIELVRTVRSARRFVLDVQKQITPTLDHVQKITDDLQPAVAKIDPLVERVSLTVDAANLELMRCDQILEDVGDVTDTLSNASKAIDDMTQAPLELVTTVSDKVRSLLKGSHANAESSDLADRQMPTRPQDAPAPRGAHSKAPEAPVSQSAVQLDSEAEAQPAPEAKYFTYRPSGKVEVPGNPDSHPTGSRD